MLLCEVVVAAKELPAEMEEEEEEEVSGQES